MLQQRPRSRPHPCLHGLVVAACSPARLPASHQPLPAPPCRLQFGEGYVLTRLPVLATQDKATREERARMLALLGHLLKLNVRQGGLPAVP